ncbi:MAG: BRCT domain-containing protein, partial [Rubripirellula sp.]
FLRMVAYRPTFEKDARIVAWKATDWGKQGLVFDSEPAATVLGWLKDVRKFSPGDLGFEWLFELVQRTEPLYHDFAVETLTKGFLPADFATSESEAESSEKGAKSDEPIQVDLDGATFVFTGKLQTMTRGEAQSKVTNAGGANSNSVTKKLAYLVIGDEGSPLYGQGRKGSKQTKGEKLNEDGAEIRIISERAFLQMLAGEQREFSEDAVQDGCERLWSMMCEAEQPDAPLARFALTYLRHHHPEICLAETDRPVDPGAEIPESFLTFDRVLPLFRDARRPLREFALEVATWEFNQWSPPIDGIVTMCESPYLEVREFAAKAMTVEDLPEHRRYRLDPDVLTPDAVYSFCESRNRETRALGMLLIGRHARLQVPDELFRLTESPDGSVRAFVIRTFWSLYRDRGITDDWKPAPPVLSKRKKKKQRPDESFGLGAPPRPEDLPAEMPQLQALLRRILFEVPPGRPPKGDGSAVDEMVRMRPMPARQAKLKLIETLRDLAIEDVAFAEQIVSLLREFKLSRGKSEQAACLVAVTRMEHAHPRLRTETSDVEVMA